MKINKIVICILLFIIASMSKESSTNKEGLFPQFLWTFWDGDLENKNSQIFLKLCLKNMEQYATRSGWQFNLVTFKNLPQYLSKDNYQKCIRLIGFVNQNFKQIRADIIRLFLLKQNGGMWVDASTFFIEDLGWINNITRSNLPVNNKLTKQPDFISFRLQGYDKPNTVIWDKEINKTVIVSPGIQNWAMISKINAKFVQDALEVIQEIIVKGSKVVEQKAIQNGIVLSQVANNSYFRFGIYTFQLVLQYKQQELDQQNAKLRAKNIGNVNLINQNMPKYAVQYYKIWTIDSLTMGFNLQTITDGIAPFLSVLFLFSNVKKIDYLSIQLKGFIKMGGIKRKYIELMLENIINPSMCFVTFEDAYKLSNQSYIYKHMIKENDDQTGLVMKEHIKNIQKYKITRQKTCQVAQQQQMTIIQKNVDSVLLFLYLLILFMFLVFVMWIKCNKIAAFQTNNMLYFLIPVLIVATIMLWPKDFRFSAQKNTSLSHSSCSNIKFQFQLLQHEQNKIYFQQLRDQLPKDNGKMFEMFFQEFIHQLKGDFSSFISSNKPEYYWYFFKYIMGIFLCFFLIFLSRLSKFDKIVKQISSRRQIKKILLIISSCLLFVTFLLSILSLTKAFSLNKSTNKSLCYIIQAPVYFSNSSDLFKQNQQNGVNYLQLFEILNNAFSKLYMLTIGFRIPFQQKTSSYLVQLQSIKPVLSSIPQSHLLLKLIQNKQELVKSTKLRALAISNTLVCQNRLMYLLDFVLKNLTALSKKLILFLNNYVKLSNFSLLFSAIPFALSLIFCMFSGILLINNFKSWRSQKQQMSFKKYRSTIVLLIILSFIISFSLQGIIMINYYFCDFLSIYKSSLRQSNKLIMSLVPDKCLSQTIGDLFQQNLNQNFRMRQKPLKDFLSLSGNMNSIMHYSFDKQEQLILKISSENNNKLIDFHNVNNEYNLLLQNYVHEYNRNKIEIQKIVQQNYHIPVEIDLVKNLQTLLFQPLCVFNFNILYEMAAIFRYFGYFSLIVLLIALLIQSKDIVVIDKLPQCEKINLDQIRQNQQEIELKQRDENTKFDLILANSTKALNFDYKHQFQEKYEPDPQRH